jgi:hypothetical protein
MDDHIHPLDGSAHRVKVGQIRLEEVIIRDGEMSVSLGEALGKCTASVQCIYIVALRLPR